MLLAVDVGNTGTVIGVIEGDEILGRWEVMTSDRTSDEWNLVIRSMLRRFSRSMAITQSKRSRSSAVIWRARLTSSTPWPVSGAMR